MNKGIHDAVKHMVGDQMVKPRLLAFPMQLPTRSRRDGHVTGVSTVGVAPSRYPVALEMTTSIEAARSRHDGFHF
jgi:hypothetical protein